MLTSTTPFSALPNFKSHTIYSPCILYLRVLCLFYLKYEASLRPDTASVFFFSVSHSSLKIIKFHSTSDLDSEFPHHINNEFLWLCHDFLAACDDTSILWLLFEWNRLSENIFLWNYVLSIGYWLECWKWALHTVMETDMNATGLTIAQPCICQQRSRHIIK